MLFVEPNVPVSNKLRHISWQNSNLHLCQQFAEIKREFGFTEEEKDMEDVFTWLVSFFVFIALVVLLVYQLICLSDLEYDYINAYDTASRVNKVVLPEFITQGASCVFLFFTGHWFMSLLGVPYLLYNAILYFKREHLLDVTEIFNTLNQEKKKRHYKLGYIVVLLCLSLFWLLLSTMEG